jgi:hypothetical protein
MPWKMMGEVCPHILAADVSDHEMQHLSSGEENDQMGKDGYETQ